MSEKHLINQRIIQNIVNTLLEEQGKLIGDEGYLVSGLTPETIAELQTTALIAAPANIAIKFKDRLKAMFLQDYKDRRFVFEQLIFPSAKSATNFFGAEFLHEILLEQPSPFEREEKWLGGDHYGINEQDIAYNERFARYNLQQVLDPDRDVAIYISEFALHNEQPLIYGWALATLNQPFRERVRIALTTWALHQPYEYIQLLDKLFAANDPQVHEDLASITLGLASKLKDGEAIRQISNWALQNIFNEPSKYRNVIIRQGFRSIIERGVQYSVIEVQLAKTARPRKMSTLDLLPFEQKVIDHPSEEIYPIVHDLAWYVIKRSFNDFLDFTFTADKKDPISETHNKFAKAYLNYFGVSEISTQTWAMAIAIAYMKSLGFSRKRGNAFTQASHGSKSKIFTLEEKYTWLAVHYIQGYLADHIPLRETKMFVKDYTEITSIPNPAELIEEDNLSNYGRMHDNWHIPEELSPEINAERNIDVAIQSAVEKEPTIDIEKWLILDNSDSLNNQPEEELLTLFNYTSLRDSKEYVHTSIDARAVLIEKGQSTVLLDLILNHSNRTYFVQNIDNLVGSPNTDTYSNPTDIVWMNWIDERSFSEDYFTTEGEIKQMFYTVTSVTANTVEGENEIYIPSKLVRQLLQITDLDKGFLYDAENNIHGFIKINKRDNYDRQETVVVSKMKFLQALENRNLEIVWLIDLITSKNALNESIKSNSHPMKTRKYFVYLEGDRMISTKIWDARFSNVRD
jgi:hypothetical protein